MDNKKTLTALFQFDTTGRLENILFGCANDEEEQVIKRAISRLIRPNFLNWFTKLFS
jgi:hypothetical protein